MFFAWHTPKTKREALAIFCEIVLVAGLILEIWEAVKEDKRVAVAVIAAASANERAAKLEKEVEPLRVSADQALQKAGEANERAAKFDASRAFVEKEAEELRSNNLALQEKLNNATKWREISPEQKIVLEPLLKLIAITHQFDRNPPSLVIWSQDGDAEARGYGESIKKVFDECGIPASFFVNGTTGHPLLPAGLSFGFCSTPIPEVDNEVWRAFNQAHVPTSKSGQNLHDFGGFGDINVIILIGAKPAPEGILN